MYDLTKAYKSKAQAVNAIRMTARNKGWNVLDTEAAEAHVWPTAEGFVVNNTTLNVALGFATEAEAAVAELDLKPTKGELAMEQAREDVWGKDGKGNTAIVKALQAPSKLEQDKKAAKKSATPKPEKKEPTRCDTQNGARRPLRGKTLAVWTVAESMAKGGTIPTLKQVYDALLALDPGFNKTTAGIQFYACRTYNGWTK